MTNGNNGNNSIKIVYFVSKLNIQILNIFVLNNYKRKSTYSYGIDKLTVSGI